jgi:Rieske 2Fe-2S family protein
VKKRQKLSRREFARTSVAAGAAAVALPASLLGRDAAVSPAAASVASLKGAEAAIAHRRRVPMPPEVGYGGWTADGSGLQLEASQTPAGQAKPSYPNGWREGTTIPAEYYVDAAHYANDERFIAENFWIMADHWSRIPKPGDYFVFEFGRGESLIILRDQASEVKAFHNVCRHRGSRLCLHSADFDNLRPSDVDANGKSTVDPNLSVMQLGASGNTPLFRCPYHAWTYDLTGKLISFPEGMPSGFDAAKHGLHPAHLRLVNGFIYVSFARTEPPDFETFTANWKAVSDEFQMADLRVVARRSVPTKANWKIVLENFRECYHCWPAHAKSFAKTHLLMPDNATAEQRARIEGELERHGHPVRAPQGGMGASGYNQQAGVQRPASSNFGQHLPVGYLTGSMDGKVVAPILPAKRGQPRSHLRKSATTGFTTAWLAAYDDHVAVVRFTPRDVQLTDAEIFYLVAGDAKEKDVDIPRMRALWEMTYLEDRWINENNHHGIMSSRYNFLGGQPYAASESGPSSLAKWYMSEVVPRSAEKATNAG